MIHAEEVHLEFGYWSFFGICPECFRGWDLKLSCGSWRCAVTSNNLVPHCVGAVLSSAGLSNFCRATLLGREPRSPARCQLMLEYVQKLGPKYILSRNVPPATVTRNIVRSLREGQVVVGTTDVVTQGPDTVETEAFGERIHSPGWPARISARFGVPIVPGFIRMDGPQSTLLAAEGYHETDIEKSTQRWVSNFEHWFRRYSSDWAFVLDKHWARVFSAASAPARFASRTRADAYARKRVTGTVSPGTDGSLTVT